MKLNLTVVKDAAGRFWRSRLGRLRTSTVVLFVAFVALFWVQQAYAPEQSTTRPPGQEVVPPGFVPDPEYTWVPRTNVQPPRTTTRTTTTTTPETTTPTSPTETTSASEPTSPTSPTTTPTSGPQPGVIDPDGPGLLPALTLPALPGQAPQPPPGEPIPGMEPVAPTLPR